MKLLRTKLRLVIRYVFGIHDPFPGGDSSDNDLMLVEIGK